MSHVTIHAQHLEPPAADLLSLLDLPVAEGPWFYWSTPDGEEAIAGFGASHTIVARGPERFREVASACAEVNRDLALRGEDATAGRALWVGGFGFSDEDSGDPLWEGFPPAWFVLPQVLVVAREGDAWISVTGSAARTPQLEMRAREIAAALPRPGYLRSRPAPVLIAAAQSSAQALAGGNSTTDASLRSRIQRAIEAIDRGDASKVVLSTAQTFFAASEIDPIAVLSQLRDHQPGCFHFLISPRPGVAFIGASPERLVRVAGDQVTTMALAGSAPRDPDPVVDQALGEALLASAKDRAEHALVVEAVRAALADCALSAPAEPRLRRLATIQHLETPIDGRLHQPADLLTLAARLHPTPALGGVPRDAALSLIRELETTDRGWYGGAVGWIDGRGDGDLAVAIRSLLIRDRAVTAFAGAGIVAGSDTDVEVREIEMKLRSTLDALTA
jgi:menaquinone-specific isochorismate synthase